MSELIPTLTMTADERSQSFIRHYMTDKAIEQSIKECRKRPSQDNNRFLAYLCLERCWRQQTGNHYSEEQKDKDTLAWFKTIESLTSQGITASQAVAIRWPWWHRNNRHFPHVPQFVERRFISVT